MIDLDKVLAWRSTYFDRFCQDHRLQNLDLAGVQAPGRPFLQRAFGLAFAVMLLCAAAGGFYALVVLKMFSVTEENRTIFILGGLIGLGIIGSALKLASASIGEAFGFSRKEEGFWRLGLSHLQKDKNIGAFMLSKSLSSPYSKAIQPRWAGVVGSVARLRRDPEISQPLAVMLNDLLFSEVWLDRVCNSGSSTHGVQPAVCQSALMHLYTGSDKIKELFGIIHGFENPALNEELDKAMEFHSPFTVRVTEDDVSFVRAHLNLGSDEQILYACKAFLIGGIINIKVGTVIITNHRVAYIEKKGTLFVDMDLATFVRNYNVNDLARDAEIGRLRVNGKDYGLQILRKSTGLSAQELRRDILDARKIVNSLIAQFAQAQPAA
jgi:hypothetical protein